MDAFASPLFPKELSDTSCMLYLFSVGAGCSQLLSDMQAFKVKFQYETLAFFLVKAFLVCDMTKASGQLILPSIPCYSCQAANPGCILEDFVRWHSPPDWMENDTSSDLDDASDGGDLSIKGQLSTRMQKEGNYIMNI